MRNAANSGKSAIADIGAQLSAFLSLNYFPNNSANDNAARKPCGVYCLLSEYAALSSSLNWFNMSRRARSCLIRSLSSGLNPVAYSTLNITIHPHAILNATFR
jgi:hypothetical protein